MSTSMSMSTSTSTSTHVIIKERMRSFEFDNSIDDNEDDAQLNLFGANKVECDPKITSLIGARLTRIHTNSNDDNPMFWLNLKQ